MAGQYVEFIVRTRSEGDNPGIAEIGHTRHIDAKCNPSIQPNLEQLMVIASYDEEIASCVATHHSRRPLSHLSQFSG